MNETLFLVTPLLNTQHYKTKKEAETNKEKS